MKGFKQISWQRIAIILLIAVFSIVGFISCQNRPTQVNDFSQTEEPDQGPGGPGITVTNAPIIDGGNIDEITGGDAGNTGGDSGNTGGDSGNTGGDAGNTGGDSGNTGGDAGNTGGDAGNTGGDDNLGYQPITPEKGHVYTKDDLYTVYIPGALKDHYYAVVSYKDTNALDKLWKKYITREGANDGTELFIRNKPNTRKIEAFKSGNDYYYFDENFDIILKKFEYRENKKNVLKKYLGAVITWYQKGDHQGTYTIAGLYRTELTTAQYTGYNDDGLNLFMGHNGSIASKDKGELEIFCINKGWFFIKNGEKYNWGAPDLYFANTDKRRDPNTSPYLYDTTRFFGHRPEEYMPKLGYAFYLNNARNPQDAVYYYCVPGNPEIVRK